MEIPGARFWFCHSSVFIKSLYIFICICAYPTFTIAQHINHDTAYISDHTTDLTIRAFGGYASSGYKLGQHDVDNRLTYKSNDNFILGAGINYRFIGLNIGFKAPFVNNDNTRFGKTKMLDLQTHIYTRKFTIDLSAQLGKGYYIKNNGLIATALPIADIIPRPDLATRTLGINAHYIFNNRRFSYRAAFVQSEYQKKSADSFLLGAGIHQFYIRADSAIVPGNNNEPGFFNGSAFNKSRVFCLALNAGYVQTVVIRRHLFLTAALMGGIGMNTTELEDEQLHTTNTKTALQLDGTLRLAAGYNSERYFAGIQYIYYLAHCSAPFAGTWQEFESGYFRVTVAKRFPIKRNLVKDAYNTIFHH